MALLAAATHSDPVNARYPYVYAVALHDAGQINPAIEILERNVRLHPYDRDSLAALVSFCEQAGKSVAALNYAQRLYELDPDDPQVRQLLKTMNLQAHH